MCSFDRQLIQLGATESQRTKRAPYTVGKIKRIQQLSNRYIYRDLFFCHKYEDLPTFLLQ